MPDIMRNCVVFCGLIPFLSGQGGTMQGPNEWERLATERMQARNALQKAFDEWERTEPDLERRLTTGDPAELKRAIQHARQARRVVNDAKVRYYDSTQKYLQASLTLLRRATLR